MAPTPRKDKKRTISNNNFLEALRSLGEDAFGSNDYSANSSDAFDRFSRRKSTGELKQNQPFEFSKTNFGNNLERKTWQFQQEHLDIRHQERLIFTKTEQETKLQIAAILEELKKLALSAKNLAKEVEVAATQVPPEPGVYHVSFFEKLRQTLIFLRKKIDESATWLTAYNHRSKKKNYYWGQFKKSGTKFLLSQERYMSTQAG